MFLPCFIIGITVVGLSGLWGFDLHGPSEIEGQKQPAAKSSDSTDDDNKKSSDSTDDDNKKSSDSTDDDNKKSSDSTDEDNKKSSGDGIKEQKKDFISNYSNRISEHCKIATFEGDSYLSCDYDSNNKKNDQNEKPELCRFNAARYPPVIDCPYLTDDSKYQDCKINPKDPQCKSYDCKINPKDPQCYVPLKCAEGPEDPECSVNYPASNNSGRDSYTDTVDNAHLSTQCNDSSSERGSITIKKVDPEHGIFLPGALYKITPNPYSRVGSLITGDNNIEDCDGRLGSTTVDNIEFGNYHIEELKLPGPLTIRTFGLPLHTEQIHPVINIVERTFSSQLLNNVIKDQYLITVKGSLNDLESIIKEIQSLGANIIYRYQTGIIGLAIETSDVEILKKILSDPRISHAEQDQFGIIAGADEDKQIIPSGVRRTDGSTENFTHSDNHPLTAFSNRSSDRHKDVDIDIAIIDTGVSLSHPDLNIYRNISFIGNNTNAEDYNGHGSHVAGIAAAKDNSIGVIGIAPGARIWALKVCDIHGRCPLSSQIAAIQYVSEHADEIDVVNFSIENRRSPVLDETIRSSIKRGVTYVVSAGNHGGDATDDSPSGVQEVITVSSIGDSDGKCGGNGNSTSDGNDDTFATFSNYGLSVDVAAPGVDIFSTYNGTEFGIDSGTSMAAPHVAGAVALFKSVHHDASQEEILDWLVASGSNTNSVCDGGARGYYSEDPDVYSEPLLYITTNLTDITLS